MWIVEGFEALLLALSEKNLDAQKHIVLATGTLHMQ
jgi:hypothetical protein